MKITPLILFFILLVVLVLSIVFSRYLPLKNTQEGLIGFNSSSGNEGNSVNIPQYNGTSGIKVKHIHDSLYFDIKNGNLIEINGQNKINDDDTGNTAINGIAGMTRNQTQFTYSGSSANTITESSVSSVSSSFNHFIYTTPSNFVNNEKYKVVYISYASDTILHIFKITDYPAGTLSRKNFLLIKTAFINSGTLDIKNWSYDWLLGSNYSYRGSVKTIQLSQAKTDSSKENIIVSVKDNSTGSYANLYQLMRSAIYDQDTGNLFLLKSDDGSTRTIDKAYRRNGDELEIDYERPTNPSLLTDSTVSHPWGVPDSDNNLIVFYPFSNKTVIVVLREVGDDGNLSFGPVVRFNGKQLDNGYTLDTPAPSSSSDSGSSSSSGSGSSSSSSSGSSSSGSGSGSSTSDTDRINQLYDLWLYYFDSLASSGTSNDYILKTQIVPPVCPQCPDCNCGDGVCTTCGGNGGSGTRINNDRTRGATGQSNNSTTDKILNDNKNNQDTRFNNPNIGGTISNVSGDVTGLVGSTVGTAGGLVGSTIGTAGGIVNNAVNTAGGLLYSAGSGAVNLLKPGQSQTGPVGINYQTQQPGVQQRDQYYSQGQINTPVDNYSQYGALPSRGGNYMPMTADFSQFGK